MQSIPPVDGQPLEAIGFHDWKAALGKAKSSSMRGTWVGRWGNSKIARKCCPAAS